jgi:Uma2 family endonuclease
MVQQLVPPVIDYPSSDGKPLADNTIQFRLIATVQGGLDALLPDAFVAADLLWYPVEGDNKCKRAPDIMVVFGRPKGDRRSYLQWKEENIAPQVVFEIASDSNTVEELEGDKFRFYQKYGVEEYYLHDPERHTLKGWLRQGTKLKPIAQMQGWVSPRLKVRFELVDGLLQLYRPDGERLATYPEIVKLKQQAQAKAEQAQVKAEQAEAKAEQERAKAEQAEAKAEQERAKAEQAETKAEQERAKAEQAETKAEQERAKAEQAETKAEQERAKAEQAETKAEQERAKAARLAERLRELGIDPDSL